MRAQQIRILRKAVAVSLLFAFLHLLKPVASVSEETSKILILYNPDHPVNRFVPSHAFGAAIDGHEKGEVDLMLSRHNVHEMLSVGLKPLSYRLRTELASEAWHWNPRGTLREGYWTSSSKSGPKPISVSYGYRLPRRGNTFDQANNDGYSRLDDGDLSTFWKSNPYLDQNYTGEPNTSLAQWILIDLGKGKQINGIRLHWGFPFATNYEVQYARFSEVADISQTLPDQWKTFPKGEIRGATGGIAELRLTREPVETRFVRVLLKESSHTSHRRSFDVRERLGYAIREISVGTFDNNGIFHDEIRHTRKNSTQTPIYVSSTDSWHRQTDQDPLIEQPGFDRIFNSGLTNGLPMLIPVGVLYNTPDDAAAELHYLKSHGYRVERLELGEEPDGQFVTPEDYGALYIQFARALHKVDPKIKLGGPSFQDIAKGKDNWLRRFLKYLNDHGRTSDYNFASFEWYPFDDVCKPTGPQLRDATMLLSDSFKPMMAADLNNQVPWLMTEYGYSAFGGRAEIDLEGALLNADAVANFLVLGGEQTFLYGYEPNYVIGENKCTRGNNMLFLIGDNEKIAYRMPTYHAAKLLTNEWTEPGDGVHQLYQVLSDDPVITAYAVLRPDKFWSVLLVNKDPGNSHCIEIQVGNKRFVGELDVYQYSRKQYQLSDDYRPLLDEPPEHSRMEALPGLTFSLPAYSLTVVRGRIGDKN